MELALTLGGDTTNKPFMFLENSSSSSSSSSLHEKIITKDVGFCMSLGKRNENQENYKGSTDPLLQLDLLPFSPVIRNKPSLPWLNKNSLAEPGGPAGKAVERNRRQLAAEEVEEGADLSSPNSGISTFEVYRINNGKLRGKRDHSDEEADGSARKKLRLTKEQSAFLEDSFKEHSTLNPKQKVALANQLNLRPRQVEVWFQNRRARTKLKQTEVDCEYLKKCCETLTEENKKLHKEIQELRALKSSQPFYNQLPATTLTMCPSCERTTSNSAATATVTANVAAADTALSLAKPQLFQFPPAQVQSPQAAS